MQHILNHVQELNSAFSLPAIIKKKQLILSRNETDFSTKFCDWLIYFAEATDFLKANLTLQLIQLFQ